jgi:integrase
VASIVQIKGPSGPRWKAVVRRKKNGRLVYSRARTFARRALAVSWAARLEGELQDPAKLAQAEAEGGPTVGYLIRRFIKEVDAIRPLGRSHRATLELLLEWPIASKSAAGLKASDLIEHCEARRMKGTGPATVMQDVVLLRGPLGIAAVKWNLEAVSTKPIEDAMPLLTRLDLVARPGRRDRRLTGDEGHRLIEFFRKQDEDSVIPMADIMDFALWTARRMGEITRVTWADLDREKRALTVRNLKDPRRRGGDLTFPLLGDAMAIIERQPVVDERIFPFKTDSVGSRFTRAKALLKIKDLRFHDLRRECVSRLFEAGYEIHEVAQVTGHKSLDTLWAIYTKLHPEKFKRRA